MFLAALHVAVGCHSGTLHAAVGNAALLLPQYAARALPAYQLPAATQVTLPNGLRCFLLEDHFLPTFRFALLYPGGRVYDPAGQSGLHDLLAAMQRRGGTHDLAPTALNELLEQRAIQIGFNTGWEDGTASVSCLRDQIDTALTQLFAMMYAPRFDAAQFDILLHKTREGIRRQNDDPTAIGGREFRKLLYGAASIWARTPTEQQIGALQIDDLRAAHAQLFDPAHMLCAAAGDFSVAELTQRLTNLMAAYHMPVVPLRARTAVERTFIPGIWIAPKATTQTVINAGMLGVSRDNPDRFALYIMNEVFGSPATFTSWLTSEIRTKAGLAYETWSQLSYGPPRVPGILQIHAKTRSEVVGKTVQLLRAQLARLIDGRAISAASVEEMKQAVLKQLVFQHEDAFRIVSDQVRFLFLGYPENYLEIFAREIGRVTLEEVRRVAKQYLTVDGLSLLFVGDPHTLRPQLESLKLPIQEWPLE